MSLCEKVTLGKIYGETPSRKLDVKQDSAATDRIRNGEFRVLNANRYYDIK